MEASVPTNLSASQALESPLLLFPSFLLKSDSLPSLSVTRVGKQPHPLIHRIDPSSSVWRILWPLPAGTRGFFNGCFSLNGRVVSSIRAKGQGADQPRSIDCPAVSMPMPPRTNARRTWHSRLIDIASRHASMKPPTRSESGIASHQQHPHYQDIHFVDFDSHGNRENQEGDNVEEDEYSIPYDKSHRPMSTLDIDHIIPNGKPVAVVDEGYTPAPSPEPIRGRSRQRELPPKKHGQPQKVVPSTDTGWLLPGPSAGSQTLVTKSHNQSRSMSHHTEASSSPSVFDDAHFDAQEEDDRYTEPTGLASRGASVEDRGYDLKPPPPSNLLENIEYLSERLFSIDHLRLILRDSACSVQFRSFLRNYRPGSAGSLEQYTNAQKAISAIEYANAIAESMGGPGSQAASLDEDFEPRTRDSVEDLVNNALPGYVTHRLVQIATEVMVKEITGQNTPIMRELVAGLAEVYCLTDPGLPDNPIVYASEEFYRCTQYGKNYVIGRNCRFLQGPKSSDYSVQRLVDALAEGQEICETILNYRRDGSPFMNLLMIAPLYDNKGSVRYFIGAQIDVNGLIEGGRGLDSFEKLLAEDRSADRYGGRKVGRAPEKALGDLAGLFDETDQDVVRHGASGKNSLTGSDPIAPKKTGPSRRFVGMDDPTDKGLWPAAHLGPSGRLPGVFQNYLLIRPYPSLRITFTSPALRLPGLLQCKFLDRIGGHPRIRDQILDAMSSGVGVTARITWLVNAHSGVDSNDADNRSGSYKEHSEEGEQRWIHATPLLGSDEKVGVWMVIMVDNGDRSQAAGLMQGSTPRPNSSNNNNKASDGTIARQRQRTTSNARPGPDALDGIQRARDAKSRGETPQPRVDSAGRSNKSSQSVTAGAGQLMAPQRYGSPKVFPHEIRPVPVSGAYGGGATNQEGTNRARQVAEKAVVGEYQFKDF